MNALKIAKYEIFIEIGQESDKNQVVSCSTTVYPIPLAMLAAPKLPAVNLIISRFFSKSEIAHQVIYFLTWLKIF